MCHVVQFSLLCCVLFCFHLFILFWLALVCFGLFLFSWDIFFDAAVIERSGPCLGCPFFTDDIVVTRPAGGCCTPGRQDFDTEACYNRGSTFWAKMVSD